LGLGSDLACFLVNCFLEKKWLSLIDVIFMEPDMEIFLCSSKIERKGEEIQGMLEELLLPDQLDVIRSVDSLSEKLQKPWEKKPIVIILVYKKDELLDLVSIREQLHQMRLILVLPDAEKGTISLAHRLRPNYLTYFHSDPQELRIVLQRMLKKK
jgi:hypothetical protein